MKETKKVLTVKGAEIAILKTDKGDFLSLTDMAKSFGGEKLVENWIRSKNTIEFLGVWEGLYNSKFNSLEFEGIKNASGTNRFVMSVKQWIAKTGALGIEAKTGRYGSGTYAHEDIAMEFATWLSPEFRLYVVKEFKRLKEEEAQRTGADWNIRRVLAKANYRIHTDAIKDSLPPGISRSSEAFIYADEADLLNLALFGMTAKQWRDANPNLSGNIRDHASIIELTVMSNLESHNSVLVRDGMSKTDRFHKLSQIAKQQVDSLSRSYFPFSSDAKLLSNPPASVPDKETARQKFAEIKKRISKLP